MGIYYYFINIHYRSEIKLDFLLEETELHFGVELRYNDNCSIK